MVFGVGDLAAHTEHDKTSFFLSDFPNRAPSQANNQVLCGTRVTFRRLNSGE